MHHRPCRTSLASGRVISLLAAMTSISAGSGALAQAGACPPRPDEWYVVWEDNFDTPTLNPRWRVENAFLIKNNELQYYAPDEVYLQDGKLVLRSRQRNYNGRPYTSGLVDTINRFSQMYGRFEARMKTPRTQGIWPAFWMLPNDGAWPPEIDIMELLGHEPNKMYMTHHWGIWPGVASAGSSFTGPDFSQQFTTFSVEWTPGRIDWFVDGVLRRSSSFNGPERPMYLILNTAVGGDWPGNPNASTVFPQHFEIDWVRVWYRDNLPKLSTLINNGFEEGSAVANPPAPVPAWPRFGNVSTSTTTARTGTKALKVFGQFNSQPNVSGATQSLPAKPGQVWRATAYASHVVGDTLQGANTAVVKLEWLNAAGQVISSIDNTVLTSATSPGSFRLASLQGTAPVGTARAQIALLVLQSNNSPGAAHFDDPSLQLLSSPPSCSADINGDGQVSVQDIFDFLAYYFASCWKADIDGNNAVRVQDIFDYLARFFSPC